MIRPAVDRRLAAVCLCLCALSSVEAAAPIAARRDQDRGLPRQVFFAPQAGLAALASDARSDALASSKASALLAEQRELLFGDGAIELEQSRIRHSLSGSQVFHQQRHRGVEVEGAQLTVHLDRRGAPLSITSFVRPQLSLRDVTPSQSLERALQIARADAAMTDRVPPRGRLVVLPRDGGRLAWRVELSLWAPFVDWLAYVDAETGELIEKRDRMVHEKPVPAGFSLPVQPMQTIERAASLRIAGKVSGTGLVLPSNPLDGHPERYALRDGNPLIDTFREDLAIERLDGSGYLRGTYADVENNDMARANVPTLDFDYSSLTVNGHFHEVNTYWHVDVFQHYITTTLGVAGANDESQLLRVHQGEDDNSSYSPGTDYIRFGDGGVDDSADGEIVLHEYGHAVHDAVSGMSFTFENSALSEGFGDYCAATFSGNALVGEWDATSYSPGPPPYLRRTDLPLVYPDNVDGSVHSTGRIISSAWWDLRTALGAELADRLIFESFFLFSSQGGFQDFADATQQVDLALYGGAHLVDIFAAYDGHGIPMTSLLSAQHTPLSDTIDVDGPFTITARVASTRPLAAVQPVRLFHRFQGGLTWTETAMNDLGSGTFSVDIAGPGVRKFVEYYIRVSNELAEQGFSPVGAPTQFHRFEAGAGSPAPSISHLQLRDLPLEAWPPRIVARVSHPTSVASVEVRWSIGLAAQSPVSLQQEEEGLFAARLPQAPIEVGDAIRYEIVALSSAGDGGESVDGPYSFVVLAPARLLLQQNQPNPFNPSTDIHFVLPQRGAVRLVIYDVAGRVVRVLLDATLEPGQHQRRWDGRDEAGRRVGSGVYLYQLQTAAGMRAKRMTLIQ